CDGQLSQSGSGQASLSSDNVVQATGSAGHMKKATTMGDEGDVGLPYRCSTCKATQTTLARCEVEGVLCNLWIVASATFDPFINNLSFVRLLASPAAFKEFPPGKRVESSFDRYDNEEGQKGLPVHLADSLCPKKRIVQLWRGIGLYPDDRLKKKAMCAMPFRERCLQRDFMNFICEVEPSPFKVGSLKKWVEKVDESVANTIKEQLSERVITTLFTNNNVVLPPGKNAYDIIDALVSGDNVQLLAAMYHDLCWLGVESNTYLLLLETIDFL
nr:ribosomal protein S19, mitochondrial-like [Tanacetum cinerariifolium]